MDWQTQNISTECNCNDVYQQFKEQFIHDLYDNEMIDEIISELTKGKNKDVTINQVLPWARWVEVQRVQTAVLNDLKIYQEFDAIWSQKQTNYKQKPQQRQQNMCKYFESSHPSQVSQHMGRDVWDVANWTTLEQ